MNRTIYGNYNVNAKQSFQKNVSKSSNSNQSNNSGYMLNKTTDINKGEGFLQKVNNTINVAMQEEKENFNVKTLKLSLDAENTEEERYGKDNN